MRSQSTKPLQITRVSADERSRALMLGLAILRSSPAIWAKAAPSTTPSRRSPCCMPSGLPLITLTLDDTARAALADFQKKPARRSVAHAPFDAVPVVHPSARSSAPRSGALATMSTASHVWCSASSSAPNRYWQQRHKKGAPERATDHKMSCAKSAARGRSGSGTTYKPIWKNALRRLQLAWPSSLAAATSDR